jgi:hypothetical protein
VLRVDPQRAVSLLRQAQQAVVGNRFAVLRTGKVRISGLVCLGSCISRVPCAIQPSGQCVCAMGLILYKGTLRFSAHRESPRIRVRQAKNEHVTGTGGPRMSVKFASASVGQNWNTITLGIKSWASVSAVALLQISSSPPILAARSRMTPRPQCLSRPERGTCGSIPTTVVANPHTSGCQLVTGRSGVACLLGITRFPVRTLSASCSGALACPRSTSSMRR